MPFPPCIDSQVFPFTESQYRTGVYVLENLASDDVNAMYMWMFLSERNGVLAAH